MPADRPLSRLDSALAALPVEPLGNWPTPVTEIELRDVVPEFRGRAWVKREDLSAADAGGNKVRKLEYLLGAARADGAQGFVTVGGFASNHCFAAAYHGSRAGLTPHLVLFPQPLGEAGRRRFEGNLALAAGLTYCPSANLTPLYARRARHRIGGRSVSIPPGGSNVLGTIGFANAGAEIAEQLRAGALDPPDLIFVATSSAGSAAGLALGTQLAGLRPVIVAVRVYPPPLTSELLVRALARRARARLRKLAAGLPPLDFGRIRLERRYLGDGYAVPTPEGTRALDAAAGLGLALDPTYSAKAFAALLDAARSTAYRSANLLFMLTYDARTPAGLPPVPDDIPPRMRNALRAN